MSLKEKIQNFLNSILARFTKNSSENLLENDITHEAEGELIFNGEEEKINVAKRTLMTRLYIVEQEITVFENTFPDEYQKFMEKIEMLRKMYNSSLEEIRKTLTYEIDPEIDGNKIGEVLKLEREVKRFIETEVKADIILKQLQKLIKKLNITYNVSIFHSKECEKEKYNLHVKKARDFLRQEIQSFKKSDYILCDKQLRERIISLISYADYEIFKICIRNSNQQLDELIKGLIMLTEFDEFNYNQEFEAFIKDEISDLNELIELVSVEELQNVLKRKSVNILTELTYSENQIVKFTFWDSFLEFESSVLKILKTSGVDKDKIKVKVIERMKIDINENEVLILPKTCAYLALLNLYATTHDERIGALIEFLNSISNEVTYEEIYFLLLLFDVIEIIKDMPNELIRHIKGYFEKYSYDRNSIMKKKQYVKESLNKHYVVAFMLDECKRQFIATFEKLNIDFKVEENKIFINSCYFNNLKNVISSLQNNTKNMMI